MTSFDPKLDSIIPAGQKAVKVRIVKQWRGLAPGDEPRLTEERAKDLLDNGYAEELRAPELVAAAQPTRSKRRKRVNVNPHSYNRPGDRTDHSGGSQGLSETV